MRNIIGLLILGTFLTGCYSSSLTMVGPATGVASGKVGESAITSSFNYVVKKQTGKSAIEHVLTESQIKKVDKNKSKINPCNKNKDLCAVINTRIENTRKKLLNLNLQARVEKKHQEFHAKPKK